MRKGTIHGSMKMTDLYHDNSQLAFYKHVVSILVSVYRYQQRVDTPTVHALLLYTPYTLTSYIRQTQSPKWSQLLTFNDCTCKSLTAPKIKQ